MIKALLGVAGVAALIALWEGSARAGWVNPALLTPPSEVAPVWWRVTINGELSSHIAWTMARIWVGVAIGSLFGFTLAIACHLLWAVRASTRVVVEIIRAIPPFALLPAFLILFGIGFRFPVAIIVWVTWIPVFLNTLAGLDEAPSEIKEAAALETNPFQVTRHITIPVAAPQIIVGLRLALGGGFLTIVVAEMLGSTVGVGYYILDASSTFRIPEMYAAILTLGAMAVLSNWLLVAVTSLLWPHARESSPFPFPVGRSRKAARVPAGRDGGTSPATQPKKPSPQLSSRTEEASGTTR